MKIKTVVADASTLIGLSRIEQLNLLRELYGEVVIPQKLRPQNISKLRKLPTVRW